MLFAVLLSCGLLVWSLVANLVIGDQFYVTRNLVLAVLLLVLARGVGLTWRDLGLDPEALGDGVRVGRLAVLVVAVVVALGAGLADVVPGIGSLLADRRADLPFDRLVFDTLIRIPIGTALFEEIAFRGVLLAAFLQIASTWSAVAWSSLVFGLWHIAPTIVALRLNDVVPTSAAGWGSLIGAVVITTVAGAAFSWLRLVSGSLAAPILAHWATNSFGLLAAAVTQRAGGAGSPSAG